VLFTVTVVIQFVILHGWLNKLIDWLNVSHANLVNSIARQPLNGFEPNLHKYWLHFGDELVRFQSQGVKSGGDRSILAHSTNRLDLRYICFILKLKSTESKIEAKFCTFWRMQNLGTGLGKSQSEFLKFNLRINLWCTFVEVSLRELPGIVLLRFREDTTKTLDLPLIVGRAENNHGVF